MSHLGSSPTAGTISSSPLQAKGEGIADAKKRVVVATARPGDVFEIQSQGEGRLRLVRLEAPRPAPKMKRARCLKAIASAPLRTTMSWGSLKAMTREP